MSYSVCIKCQTMVSAYEKYCPGCVDKYGVQQDETFHKRSVPIEQWPAEFQKDREIAKIQKHQSQVLEFQKSQWRIWNNMDTLCRRIVKGELRLRFSV